MLSRLFIATLWSLAGKGLIFWLSFVMLNCDFVTVPCDILGQVWHLIVSIPDLCHLSSFKEISRQKKNRSQRVKQTQFLLILKDSSPRCDVQMS